MGPPNAAEGLTQCYALGADRGILLSDRALAGSDTLATAQALALALQRESPTSSYAVATAATPRPARSDPRSQS